MPNTRPLKSISLFSGAGGLDIGVKNAGFNVLACLEIDPFACDTLRANIAKSQARTKVYEADIRTIKPQKMALDLKIKPGELDLLFGGSPCQSFSQIGKQMHLEDERGLLVFEIIRFARHLRPRCVLAEQVKGFLSARGPNGIPGEVFTLFRTALEDLGYTVHVTVLNSADYGVPQLRQRVFLAAFYDERLFKFPEPTHTASGEGLPRHVTVGDALKNLHKPSSKLLDDPLPDNSHHDITPAGDRLRIHNVPEGECLVKQENLPASQKGKLTMKDTTKFLRLSRSRPSNTLRCGEIFFHPTADRYLTPREYMRIHTYPDDFIAKGPIRGRTGRVSTLDQHRQVANSVPPLLAEQIAVQIRKSLQCQRSSKYLDIELMTRARPRSAAEKTPSAPSRKSNAMEEGTDTALLST